MNSEVSKAVTVEHAGTFQFTQQDKKDAASLRKQIASTVDEIIKGYSATMKGFVRLGSKVLEVRTKKYWCLWGYASFGEYIRDLSEYLGRKRTQVYNSIGVAERLLPHVPEKDLEAIGISKCSALARMVRITGKAPSQKIVEQGKKLELTEYRAKLAEEFRVFDTRPGEKYRDLGGFYATDDEWKEIKECLDLARQILVADGEITQTTPEPLQLKLCLTRITQAAYMDLKQLAEVPSGSTLSSR